MKISFIIPIYNTSAYLENLIFSLNDKNYFDVEFIFIDDGSKDDSLNVLNVLLKDFKSIYKVIAHKNNKGLSCSRNVGIDNAEGEYLYFLDSDDWLNKNSISYMLNLIKKYEEIDIFIFNDKKRNEYVLHDINYDESYYYFGNNLNFLAYRHMSSCVKLYKRNLFDTVRYKELLYEDVPLLVDLFNLKSLNVLNTRTLIYNYRINKDGIMNSDFDDEKFEQYMYIISYIKEVLTDEYFGFLYPRLKKHISYQTKNPLYFKKLKKYEKENGLERSNALFQIWDDKEIEYYKKDSIFNVFYANKYVYDVFDNISKSRVDKGNSDLSSLFVKKLSYVIHKILSNM